MCEAGTCKTLDGQAEARGTKRRMMKAIFPPLVGGPQGCLAFATGFCRAGGGAREPKGASVHQPSSFQ
jgi:hypothetical protein